MSKFKPAYLDNALSVVTGNVPVEWKLPEWTDLSEIQLKITTEFS